MKLYRKNPVTVSTECAPPDDKNEFYNSLEDHLEEVKTLNIHHLVVGDFNSRVDVGASSGIETLIRPHYDKQQVDKLVRELQSLQYCRIRLWTPDHASCLSAA